MVYNYYILYFIAFLLLYLLIVDFVFLFNSTDYNGTSKLDDSATKADRMIDQFWHHVDFCIDFNILKIFITRFFTFKFDKIIIIGQFILILKLTTQN